VGRHGVEKGRTACRVAGIVGLAAKRCAVSPSSLAARSPRQKSILGRAAVHIPWRHRIFKSGSDAMNQGSVLELFLSHRASLVRYATPIVGCASLAEEVVQEAYIRFAPADGKPGIRFRVGYLYRIVHNLALDAERAQVRARNYLADMLGSASIGLAPGPDQELADREALDQVARAIDRLSPRARGIFEQHRLEGLTLKEIADSHGISVTRVHQIFRQAMTDIADALDPWDEPPT
jgi:RNA polymerase sigma-70 factor (ECF subfamily)